VLNGFSLRTLRIYGQFRNKITFYPVIEAAYVNTKNWYREETGLWAEFGRRVPFGKRFSSKHSVKTSAVGSTSSFGRGAVLKGYGVATLAQNKIFLAKQELLLSEITGLPLDAQMQRNRLDVDERVEGSRQCSCSRSS
jgi:hypothetical protein